MKKLRGVVSLILPAVCAAALGALAGSSALAQRGSQDEARSGPTAADHAAAQAAKLVYHHAFPARTPAGDSLKHGETLRGLGSSRHLSGHDDGNAAGGGERFIGDLTYFGGAVVGFAESHAIFLRPNGNCPVATCWGDPEGFLSDLTRSDLIHVTDQYVGLAANHRYTLGSHTNINYTPTPKTAPLTDADMQAIVHFVASTSGETGYGHIYHVFLPPGQDECFAPLTATGRGQCYSPDVDANFVFCAYHNSVEFQDIGHVLYSVEPFQNVAGCNVKPGTVNGQLVDSTNSTLSHELIETITDPDGDAWFNFSSAPLFFEEIGDECVFLAFFPPNIVFSDPSNFRVGRHHYAVQPEYSNAQHACVIQP